MKIDRLDWISIGKKIEKESNIYRQIEKNRLRETESGGKGGLVGAREMLLWLIMLVQMLEERMER